MRKALIVALGAALLVGCGGGGGNAKDPTPTLQTIRGTVTINGVFTEGKSCQGSGGYSDIRPGAQVSIKNASGTIVATGGLLSGTGLPEGTANPSRNASDSFHCEFPFEVTDIPPSDFYSIEISHRGQMTYSAKDLDAKGWEVALTLGD